MNLHLMEDFMTPVFYMDPQTRCKSAAPQRRGKKVLEIKVKKYTRLEIHEIVYYLYSACHGVNSLPIRNVMGHTMLFYKQNPKYINVSLSKIKKQH